jgi:hypothetical protein
MSTLDVAKERIAYYKVWLGVMLAVAVSVFGWGVSTLGTVHYYLTIGAGAVFLVSIVLIARAHKTIERAIDRLEKL